MIYRFIFTFFVILLKSYTIYYLSFYINILKNYETLCIDFELFKFINPTNLSLNRLTRTQSSLEK